MPIPNIESKILEKVIEFCQYHHDKPKVELFRTPRGPLKGKLDELLCDYDKKFVNVEDKVLIDYMVASNYLEITEMLKVCSAKMGSDWQDMLSKDSFMEDFMERYNIPKDTFTSEEMNRGK
jgi:S-phase kinase-associated protein 1